MLFIYELAGRRLRILPQGAGDQVSADLTQSDQRAGNADLSYGKSANGADASLGEVDAGASGGSESAAAFRAKLETSAASQEVALAKMPSFIEELAASRARRAGVSGGSLESSEDCQRRGGTDHTNVYRISSL